MHLAGSLAHAHRASLILLMCACGVPSAIAQESGKSGETFGKVAAAGPAGEDHGGIAGGATGACCTIDACIPASSVSECAALGGVFLPGEDCALLPCGEGACCYKTSCSTDTAFGCITAGREYAGAGTTCLDDPCKSGIGACCDIAGSCIDLSPEECAKIGATWLGAGTSCATAPCIPGACCLLDGSCAALIAHDCNARGGAHVPFAECDDEPCATPTDCPANSLFAQQRDGPDDFLAGTSEVDPGLHRFENFSGVGGSIDGLVWWGLDLDYLGGNLWAECAEPDPTFIISFHEDAAGVPGRQICSHTLPAKRVPLGELYLGAELNEYSVSLPEPCTLVNGWVSIVGAGDSECWFLWMSAGLGASYCDGCAEPFDGMDYSICLLGEEGGAFGACCDDSTGTCLDNVEISDCTASNLRFQPDASCAQLEPPCGVQLGACCFPDATCSILEPDDCTGVGGSWLGANSSCASCPCITPCPDGAVEEGEPVCATDYDDQFNGGCWAQRASFSTIEPGQAICGLSGVFQVTGDSPQPDTDWYEFIATEPTTLTWSAEAEFPSQIAIVDGTSGCPGIVLDTIATSPCTPMNLSVAAGPGVYWMVMLPIAFDDESGCGAGYTAEFSAGVAACPADVAPPGGDGAVGAADLGALLAAWGADPGGPPDFNLNGSVGPEDLATLLAGWGACP
jgi:hypothetical protein